ncbi:oxygen-dependent coproporphyrinogen oxidase [Brumimicrobium aurantiacum]|uniref:coproporphyrinogen oxidase n=1 Tax=Brumimicrobium aurantiacum TaxID=1737063 RepID=A0A3E1EUT1_9FLAO|nr:oxygen-dependent coproporphyrinogen oxidase [Brumimicrobium aurantiacum]RFC53329.1 oxygen-dependent coproporphyrinogen oxidase [Brumimicrobium aurantiacum]
MFSKEEVIKRFKSVQDYICEQLESLDGKSNFHEDIWNREEGGGGRTRVLTDGNIIEKGGVNFSAVHGPVSEVMKKQLGLDGNQFLATGVSIVIHPKNPFHPIMHMNVRYFEMDTGAYWFGGGIDMTPHYIDLEKAKMFHQDLKLVCDKYNVDFYPRFKKWADDYFFIPHRNETRGVGGIFYDHLTEKDGLSKEELLDYAISLGELFPKVYSDQINADREPSYNQANEEWRNLRRGRYVEFNLVNDRGTKFGLKTGGRIESILMSLPKNASWFYDFKPEEASNEELTLKYLKKDIDWLKV